MTCKKSGTDGTDGERSLGNTKTRDAAYSSWVFTLNNWTENEYNDIIEWFGTDGTGYIIGKEIGEKCGTPHLQGYVNFGDKKRKRLSNLIKLNKRIHWEKAKGSALDNHKYCTKGGDYVMKNIKLPKEEIKIKIVENLLPFQKSLEQIVLGNVNEGKVIWVYDERGQSGKTQFLRYMNVKYKIPFAYGGKCADIINLAFNNKEYLNSVENPCFIYNFGRDTQNDKISYASIEQLSDGAIANTKFEAGCFVFNQPHIIVLANCLPITSKMTGSRWILKSIDENNNLIDYIIEPNPLD